MTKTQAFEIAYERDITDHYLARIQSQSPTDAKSAAGQLRSVIACIDRQEIASPITVRFDKDDLFVADLDGFQMYLDRADAAVSVPIGVNKVYEPHLIAFYRRLIKSGMTAVDIGANVGLYSMLFASLVGRSGGVFSFEPNSENCRLILLSLELNRFENVKLFPFALDEKMGALYFTPAVGSNGLILPSRRETLFNPNCIVVPAMKLDDLDIGSQVNFMKLDIEGAEYRALRGAERIIRDDRPVFTVEFSLEMISRVSGIAGPEFISWILGHGYRGYLIRGATGSLEHFADAPGLMAMWGDYYYRIEDLAFVPTEMEFEPW